jgi:hypothetical protein
MRVATVYENLDGIIADLKNAHARETQEWAEALRGLAEAVPFQEDKLRSDIEAVCRNRDAQFMDLDVVLGVGSSTPTGRMCLSVHASLYFRRLESGPAFFLSPTCVAPSEIAPKRQPVRTGLLPVWSHLAATLDDILDFSGLNDEIPMRWDIRDGCFFPKLRGGEIHSLYICDSVFLFVFFPAVNIDGNYRFYLWTPEGLLSTSNAITPDHFAAIEKDLAGETTDLGTIFSLFDLYLPETSNHDTLWRTVWGKADVRQQLSSTRRLNVLRSC